MKIIKTLARLTGAAAAAYGGYAAFTWLRYGRPKAARSLHELDQYIPSPEVIDRHAIAVKAPAEVAYEACCALDITQSRIAHALFDTRTYAMGSRPTHIELPPKFVAQMKHFSWTILEEAPGRAIVFGVAAKPWLADAGFRTIPATEFVDFNEPGFAKIVFEISVKPVAGCFSVILTETRVVTTDALARRFFRNYWSIVAPGVKLMHRTLLRAVKSAAENTVRAALRSATQAA